MTAKERQGVVSGRWPDTANLGELLDQFIIGDVAIGGQRLQFVGVVSPIAEIFAERQDGSGSVAHATHFDQVPLARFEDFAGRGPRVQIAEIRKTRTQLPQSVDHLYRLGPGNVGSTDHLDDVLDHAHGSQATARADSRQQVKCRMGSADFIEPGQVLVQAENDA